MTYSEVLELVSQIKTIESPVIDTFFPVVKNRVIAEGYALLTVNLLNPVKRHFELHINEDEYDRIRAERDQNKAAQMLAELQMNIMPAAQDLINRALHPISSTQMPDTRFMPAERCQFYNSRMNYYDS